MKYRAFTLVELLVVISIISLLIALLLPALSRAREAEQRIACASQMRGSGQAMVMYAQDNKEVIAKTDYGRQDGNTTWQGVTNNIGNSRATPDEKKTVYHGAWLTNGYLANASPFFCPGERVLSENDFIPYTQKRGLYLNEYRETFASGGITPRSGGPAWRPVMPTSYNFNAQLVPVDPEYAGNFTPNFYSLINKTDPLAGRRYYEFTSAWPVLADQRGGAVVDHGYTVNHRSQGFNVLRGDGAVKFLNPADIVRGAYAIKMNSATVQMRMNTGYLPEDPRTDDPAWAGFWSTRTNTLNSGYGFWDSVHGALK